LPTIAALFNTLLKFPRLLERHQLTQAMLAEVNAHLSERGVTMRSGTMVDATILAAPSSRKNARGERDRQRRALAQQGEFGVTLARIEQLKARIRAKVEHAFQQAVEKRSEDGQMQGARSAATETYLGDRRGSEHRATPQMAHRSSFSTAC
jgi:hypothetical protein